MSSRVGFVRSLPGFVDKHDIQVATEAEFATTEAPHGDHADIGELLPITHDGSGRYGQRAVHGDAGDGRQCTPHLTNVDGVCQVSNRDAEELPTTQAPNGGHRGNRVILPLHERRRLGGERGFASRPKFLIIGEHPHRLRCLQEQVGCVSTRRHHEREPFGRSGFVPQKPQVPRCSAECIADLPKAQQPRIGVGAVGEPPQHDREQCSLNGCPSRHTTGQRLQVANRPGWVGVPESLKSLFSCLKGQSCFSGFQARDGGQQRPVEEFLVQATNLTLV